jgi:hypothetical protein
MRDLARDGRLAAPASGSPGRSRRLSRACVESAWSLLFISDSRGTPATVTLRAQRFQNETQALPGGRAGARPRRRNRCDVSGSGDDGTHRASRNRAVRRRHPELPDQARHRDHDREPYVRQPVRQLPRRRRDPGERVVPQPERLLRLGAERLPRLRHAQRGRHPGRDQQLPGRRADGDGLRARQGLRDGPLHDVPAGRCRSPRPTRSASTAAAASSPTSACPG